MPSDAIRIKNATFYAYHGAITEEQNLGGMFEVDVEICSDLSAAKASDDLKQTLNYEAMYALLHQTVTSKKYYLLEALGSAIARGIIQRFPLVQAVTVKVRKPHPRVKGVVDYVEVEVTESKV